MIRLLLQTCVSPASSSNAHRQLELGDLDISLFFQSPDFVHYTRRYTHCLRHHKLHWQLVFASSLLALDN